MSFFQNLDIIDIAAQNCLKVNNSMGFLSPENTDEQFIVVCYFRHKYLFFLFEFSNKNEYIQTSSEVKWNELDKFRTR